MFSTYPVYDFTFYLAALEEERVMSSTSPILLTTILWPVWGKEETDDTSCRGAIS